MAVFEIGINRGLLSFAYLLISGGNRFVFKEKGKCLNGTLIGFGECQEVSSSCRSNQYLEYGGFFA